MLIQVLKQVKWLGLLYLVANNVVYQFLSKKYINEPRLLRQRRNRRVQNGPQNQPGVDEKSYKQSLLFLLLIGSWFMHNAVSLYLLDVESCGRAIYERFFKEHLEYIRANNHPIQTEFIKTFLCEQSQIVLALILVVCLLQKNYLLKALGFLVIYHFIHTYHQVKESRAENLAFEAKTREYSNNTNSISNKGESYQSHTTNILEDSLQYESPQEILTPEMEIFNNQIQEKETSGYYEPVDETKKSEEEDPENQDCFKRLPWLAYIPLKAISLGFEVALDAGGVFEYIVCKWIIG